MPALESIIVLIFTLLAVYFSSSAFQKIYAMINSGQPEKLTDNWKQRALSVIRLVLGHKKSHGR